MCGRNQQGTFKERERRESEKAPLGLRAKKKGFYDRSRPDPVREEELG